MPTAQITVNGQTREVEQGRTVADLLGELGLGNTACAVEVNRGLVPKRQHTERVLEAGDTVEVVTFVGGG